MLFYRMLSDDYARTITAVISNKYKTIIPKSSLNYKIGISKNHLKIKSFNLNFFS